MIKLEECPSTRPDYPVFSGLCEEKYYIDGENFDRRSKQRQEGSQPIIIYQTFGKVWIALEWFGRRFGIKTLSQLEREIDPSKPLNPPSIDDNVKNLGSKYSPEGICYPFKPLMGHMLQSAIRFETLREAMRGAIHPIFISHESTGLCRERTYGRLAEARLQDYYTQNYGHTKFDFYALRDSVRGVKEFISFLLDTTGKNIGASKLTKTVNFINTVNLINEAIERLDLAESFEREVRYTQSLMSRKDFFRAERILQDARLALASSDLSRDEVMIVLDKLREGDREQIGLNQLPKVREVPKGKIAIIGEIFMTEEMESSAADLGSILGLEGYYYEKIAGYSHYTHKIRLDPQRLLTFLVRKMNPFHRDLKKEFAAKAGLLRSAGGHSLETAELAGRINEGLEDFDAVIELFPFNCLPQIMTANIVKCIIPWYRLMFDEQTGIAGVKTRIEAFLDMIEKKKKERAKQSGIIHGELSSLMLAGGGKDSRCLASL